MMPRSTYWQKLLSYSYAISFTFLAAITNVIANPAAVDWLQANTTPNGEISTSTDIANPFQATSEALRTFSVLNVPPQVGTVTALQFINSESYHSTEYLVRKIIVNHLYGNDISSYVTELRGMQNWDGGYGELHAYDSSVLDTAFALDAFATINDATGSIVPGAIVYLLNQQKADGGWTGGVNESSVYTTAAVVKVLAAYRTIYTGVAEALSAAQNFLLSQQTASLWDSDFESASALLALTATMSDISVLATSYDALQQRQMLDGSWSGDVFSTALALQSIALFEARVATPNAGTATSGITGSVVKAGSGEPISGASVTLAEQPGTSVTTSANGTFSLTGIQSGTYTLVVQKQGYLGISTVVNAISGQLVNVGQLVLGLSQQSGIIRGSIYDSESQTGLDGVSVSLTGGQTYSTTTSATGYFELSNLQPGSYSLNISKAGYNTISGSAEIVAGQVLQLNQGMIKEGLYLDDSPADLKGQIIDGNTGLPIAGAQFALSNGQTVITDAAGNFVVTSVARGDYRAIASSAGYVDTNYNIIFAAGNSGNLGVLSLFAAEATQSPTTLTLHGTVLDGLTSQPINGASISVVETGELLSSDANGAFTLTDITLQSLQLTISAPNYETRTFAITVNAFGEVSAEFVLPPFVPADPNITFSTLNGTVVDQDTKLPIAEATVSIVGTDFRAITDTAGHYQISEIDQLVFDISVTALGYQQAGLHAELNVHGNYTLDQELTAQTVDPAAPDIFQILSVTPQQANVSGNQTTLINSSIGNLTTADQIGLITGEVVNSDGMPVATLTPYAPGTTTLQGEYVFQAAEIIDLQLPWDVAQNAAGTYQVIVRVIEPGSISRNLPTGRVLAEGSATITVEETRAISGGTLFDPPLTQAGSTIPVSLSALIINKSNVPLLDTSFNLVITDADTNTVLHTANAQLEQINVNQNLTLSFGDWLPTQFGSLNVQVQPADSTIDGVIIGNLYVGDKATGSFAVDKQVVPEGTQDVHATISLQGVDIKTGTSTDPLFLAVKDAVEKGGNYVGNEAINWHNRNRCLGCHIQTQSQMGLASSLDKADINESQTRFLHNTLASSQQPDGGIYLSHPYYGKTQTSLALWSLRAWPDKSQTYRTMYDATRYMHNRKQRSSNQTYWTQDHNTGYVNNQSNITALVTMGYADVIHSSDTLDPGAVRGYFLQPAQALNSTSSTPLDMEIGPDGHLYVVKLSGAVDRVDKDTKEVTTVVTGLPNNSYGLAIDEIGTMYVSGYRFLVRVNADGTKDTILTSNGYLTDVEFGSDGLLYVADHSNNRILRVTTFGQSEVLSTSSLYRNPYGLAFDSNDNLLIANNAYNILKLSPDNSLSVYASGISFRILWLDVDADDQVYASSYNPNGLYRVNQEGIAERILAHSDALRGVAIDKLTGQVFVSNETRNAYHELTVGSVTQALINEYKLELPRMVRYFLNRYQDNTRDNTIHALRMSALAEARKATSDSSLLSEIDTAIEYEANLLRNRQRSDGGWGRYSTWGSDPLVTAMVGMALDYTNPSADDPLVRNTIQYLLNTQLGDGSWNNNNSFFSTRLAATSFVMAYMPKALDRLGGIDVDLHLSLPDNIQISNLSTPATSVTPNSTGGNDYFWSLQGITSNNRVIDFDVTLQDMLLGEERPVATNAYMIFENSFTNEELNVDLDVPVVKAASELILGITTDKAVYYANENVLITSIADNTSPVIASGTVQIAIHAQGSNEPIAVLPAIPVENLTAGAQVSLPAEWNTGSQYVGSYEVVGKLLDEQGRVLSEQTAPFSIMHTGSAINSRINTDKPVYMGWDSVQINSRVRNISANVIQLPTVAIVSVTTPDGNELLNTLTNINELTAGSYRDYAEQLNLVEAATGEYSVKLSVYDAATRNLLHTSQTSFQVEQTQAQAVKGAVLASPNRVELGNAVVCENTVTNISSIAIADINVIQRLASIATGEILDEQRAVENLTENSDITKLRSIGTTGLELGGYACLLSAEINNTEIQLGAAGFEVVEPPIKIEAVFSNQGRGRLLVLLDHKKHSDKDDDDDKHDDDKYDRDPHGPKGAPTLAEQRTFLEEQLNTAGWSYTIVTDDDDFTREMRSNEFVAYALFNEHEKLDKQVQQELRERIHRGEGLLVAGSHDERNKYLNDALGIKHKGKQGKTADFTYLDSVLELTGNQSLAYKDKVLRIELQGAEIVAEYNIVEKSHDDDEHDDDDDKKNVKSHDDRDDIDDDDDDNDHKYSKAAVTAYQFGLGRSVYAGFDLLAHATALQDDNLLDDLLNIGLTYVHPVDLNIIPTNVVPITIVLTNKGIATPGRVVITIPENVQVIDTGSTTLNNQGEVILPFDLAEDAVAAATLWVQLPDVTTSLNFNASVQTGIMPDYIEYEVISLSITRTIFPGMADAITELSAISGSDKYYQKALKYLRKADKSLQEDKIKYVVKNLIKATDYLAKVTHDRAADIRVMVDYDIARYAAILPVDKHDDDDD